MKEDLLKVMLAAGMKSVVEFMVKKGMVVEKNFRHSKTRTAKYLIITPASYETLYTPSNLRVSESHFRHSLFEYRVFRWLTEKGYKPVKECQIKGGKIDVFCVVLVKDLKP